MAKKKGGAAQQQAESKKATQKKKQQIVEDKTFGLKNKNKSKKVQQHVASVTKNVMNSGDPKQRRLEEQQAKQKADRKARAKAAKEEQEALFGAALMAVQKKTTTNKKDGKIEAQGRDGNDEKDSKKTTSRAMKMMYQMDAQEMNEKLKEDPNYVPTLEDEIEEERQKKVAQLKASGKPMTKITQESFVAWQEAKRKRRAEEARKKVEAEMKKKKGGKGLSVLTGRDLYEYKRDLFQDQEEGGEEEMDLDDVDMKLPAQPPTTIHEGDETAAVASKENGGKSDSGDNKENGDVHKAAAQIQSDLFLEGADDDLDDIDDD